MLSGMSKSGRSSPSDPAIEGNQRTPTDKINPNATNHGVIVRYGKNNSEALQTKSRASCKIQEPPLHTLHSKGTLRALREHLHVHFRISAIPTRLEPTRV